MIPRILFTLLVILSLLFGCESPQDTEKKTMAPPETPQKERKELHTYQLLREPLDPVLVETSIEALPLWLKSKESLPVLVLLSNDPFLKPIPHKLEKPVIELITDSGETSLVTALKPFSPDPLLLPQMALSSALKSHMFSQIVWVISGDDSFKEQTVATFGQHLVNYGAISEAEVQTFNRTAQGFSGQIHGLPFTVVHESSLPTITEPALLHIDLSYFRPIYKGEIKTPLYELLYQTLKQLQTADIPTAAVSISHSNLGGQLPLATRFLGTTLAKLFSEPSLLAKPLPESWETRRKALYLENFFQKEKVHELYLQLLANTPQDASANYALYRSFRELNKGTEALKALAEAIRLEPAYGVEYLTLSSIALEKKRPDQALKMLDLAITAFPENPFIQLQKAELLIALEQTDAAMKLLEELQKLPWSKVYYPQLPNYIASLMTTRPATTD